jgi:sugar/nucleoside kinase (ribokinase family)
MRGRATTDAQPSDDGCATTPAKRAWCQDRQVPYDVVVFGSANVDVVCRSREPRHLARQSSARTAPGTRAARASTTRWLPPACPLPESLLAAVDVLVVNEHEAVALTGTDDPDRAARVLAAWVGNVVVTLTGRRARDR